MRAIEMGRTRRHDPIRPSDRESLVGIISLGHAADTHQGRVVYGAFQIAVAAVARRGGAVRLGCRSLAPEVC
jgi:hypothetical protein